MSSKTPPTNNKLAPKVFLGTILAILKNLIALSEDDSRGMEINEKTNFQEELYLYIRKHKFGSSEVLLNHELGSTVEVLGPIGKSK